METLATIWNLFKSIGGPRGLVMLLLVCLICALVVYLVSRGGDEEATEGNGAERNSRLSNLLIGGLGVLFVLGFLAIVMLFVYLIFLN